MISNSLWNQEPQSKGASSECEREPIHAPGGIQPCGAIVALSEAEHRIVFASENLAELIGCQARAVLGKQLESLLDGRLERMLASAGSMTRQIGERCSLGVLPGPPAVGINAHRYQERITLEFEPVPQHREPDLISNWINRRFPVELWRETSIEGAAQRAATEVRRLLGFDRVVVYRFDTFWNGQVIAEDRDKAMPSFLNLRFPATDIPAQARRLYSVNRIRWTFDIEDKSVPILGLEGEEPLDQTFCSLRTLSPAHLDYVRNMGVRASLSISIVVDGWLWGLIACHNREPRRVGSEERVIGDFLGQMLAQHLAFAELLEAESFRGELEGAPARLLGWLTSGKDLSQALQSHADELLGCARASGAALVLHDQCSRWGLTPGDEHVRALAKWISSKFANNSSVYSTCHLGKLLPGAAAYAHVGSGVVAISLNRSNEHASGDCLMWFRPELVKTTHWAGEPQGQGQQTANAVGLPASKRNFEVWTQVVRGESSPWLRAELEAVGEFRHGILNVLERKELESQLFQAQKLESIGQLAAGVAHEINTPIQFVGDNNAFLKSAFSGVKSLVESYQKLAAKASEIGVLSSELEDVSRVVEETDAEYLIQEASAAIEQSGEGISRVVKIVRAMKEFSHPAIEDKEWVDLGQLVENSVALSRHEWKMVASVVREVDPALPPVRCLRGGISQVILNLVVNAAHAIGSAQRPEDEELGDIFVRVRKVDKWAEIRIEDTGTGIAEAVRSQIFAPYFTTKGAGKGTGQGLALAWSIVVKRHGGTIDFETEVGRGTTFIVRLPIDGQAEGSESEGSL